MLYCGSTSYPITSTSDSTTTSSGWNSCPHCGTQCSSYVVLVSYERNDFGYADKPEPLSMRPRQNWDLPQSDPAPLLRALCAAMHAPNRHGRELRHRGGFRNFHKM